MPTSKRAQARTPGRWRSKPSQRAIPSAPQNSSAIAPLAGALLSAGLALVIYLRTMAPTITFHNWGADSGDLVTAAINLGVPHPTGYPLYTLLAHFFTRLPGEPARNVNLFSALCEALAVGAVFLGAYRLLATRERGGPLALVSAFSAAGVFAFGQVVWSQATISEVYALNTLWAAVMLGMLSVSGLTQPYLVALLCGFGLAHHLTAVWVLPALWPYAGSLRGWFNLRRASLLALSFLPGLLAYLYIPLRARVHPVPNWGLATNLSGLLWLVSGEAYHQFFGGLVGAQVLQRFASWAGIWVRDLGVIGLALALLGLWRSFERDRRFTVFGLSYMGLLSAYSMLYATGDSYLYLLPAIALAALWMAWGAYVVLAELGRLERSAQRWRWLAILVLLALPALSVASRFSNMDLSSDREAYVAGENVLQAAAPRALIISRGDRQTFSLWYVRYGLRQRPDVITVDRWLLAFPWYRSDLAARDPELAPLLQARDDQEAALMLVSITGRPVQLMYEDEELLKHGQWAKTDLFYTLVQ